MTTDPETKPTALEAQISRLESSLSGIEAGSDNYRKILDDLSKLRDLQKPEKTDVVSKDTIVVVAANLIGILLVIGHEHSGVITSKAFGMITRLK